MLWDHTAYCRKCRKRVYVQPRYHSSADDVFMTLATLGVYTLLKWLYPVRFGRWQCDECGSQRCVGVREVKEGEDGQVKHHRKHHPHRGGRRRRRR